MSGMFLADMMRDNFFWPTRVGNTFVKLPFFIAGAQLRRGRLTIEMVQYDLPCDLVVLTRCDKTIAGVVPMMGVGDPQILAKLPLRLVLRRDGTCSGGLLLSTDRPTKTAAG